MAVRQNALFARALGALDARILSTQETIAFQLGQALIRGTRSLAGLRALPGDLLAIRREALRRRRIAPEDLIPQLSPATTAPFLAAWGQGGGAAIEAAAKGAGLPAETVAGVLAALHGHLLTRDIVAAAEAARRAQALLPSPATARWLGLRLLDCGAISEALALIDTLPASQQLTPQYHLRIENMRALLQLRDAKPDLSAWPGAAPEPPVPGSLLYVAASCRPFHLSGYTMRTKAVVEAIAAAGVPVSVMTRPGYPWDRSDSLGRADADLAASEVDGITYHHVRFPPVSLPLDMYVEYAADAIIRVARERRVAVIHAASNHVNALPALVAARRLGLPFQYEMRGIWELSRASKVPRFEETEAFALALELEGYVATQADRLLVISPQLADYAREQWNVSADRIAVMPNGVDQIPAEIEVPPDGRTPFKLAYAGSLVPYEGLDLLIEAVARLGREGIRIEVDIIGDGESRSTLEAQVRRNGLQQQIRFAGRIAPAEARQRLAQASMVCLPRRPDLVCEIVPPLKLAEAMALGVPVLAADLPAMRGEMEHDRTGFFFAADDVGDLVRQIKRCRGDPQLLDRVRKNAHEYVAVHRTWASVIVATGILPVDTQRTP